MKICPQCQKTYEDQTLNFCLDDGSVLNEMASSSEEPPATVMMSEVPATASNKAFGTQAAEQKSWETAPRYQSSASSGSKSWLWALGILGAVVVICGGGFFGLLAIGVFVGDDEEPPITNTSRTDPKPAGDKQPPTKNTRLRVHSHDFSKWDVKGNSSVSAKYENGELVLTSQRRYYYVLLTKGYKTQNATVKLTLRNTSGSATTLGYGLIFHSDSQVLTSDYAFLIRSDTQKYRVVRHNNKREIVVINWTKSSAIKKGTQANDLEVRSDGKDTSFYINGEYIRSEANLSGNANSVAGIYTSSNVPIGFSFMEYRK